MAVTGDYSQFEPSSGLEIFHLQGVSESEGAMLVKSVSGSSLIVNDIIFNMPHQKGVTGFFLRFITASTGGPRVSRLARLLMVKDAPSLQAQFRQLAGLSELKRVIVSHHEVIADKPAAELLQVADSL